MKKDEVNPIEEKMTQRHLSSLTIQPLPLKSYKNMLPIVGALIDDALEQLQSLYPDHAITPSLRFFHNDGKFDIQICIEAKNENKHIADFY